MDGVLSVLTEQTVDGVALWVVALICVGVFLASFMDAIAGGGGIISVPTYLMALHTLPTYYALGTNKLSACIGTVFSTGRYIRGGYVEWRLFGPAAALSLLGSLGGTWLQHRTPDTVLKYLLLVVLPVVAVLTLRGHSWPDEAAPVPPVRRAAVVWGAALVIGAYDGYYGPGTGTFVMLAFVRLAGMDTRRAAGGTKVINLASNLGAALAALASGYVLVKIGLISSVAAIAGHYLGAGLAIENGGRLVRPVVVLVLALLAVKVGSELLFPGFWS